MTPAGRLLIIGNTRDKTDEGETGNNHSDRFNVAPEFLNVLTSRKDDRIEIITSACLPSADFRKECSDSLGRMGFSNYGFLHIKNHLDEKHCLERLLKAKTVLFVGEQFRIYSILKNSAVIRLLYKRYLYESHFTIAGLCLGAQCIPGIMMLEGENNMINLEPGLGFINHCIIDTQYQTAHFKRLALTAIKHQQFLGIGMAENTALIIEKGYLATCKGSGTIMVINARHIKKTDPDYRPDFIYPKNLKGHILIDGCKINLKSGDTIS
ncbi:cyanophycinase [Chryseobacterium sp. DT-3]|uniref:cyanophycinase n=1 Tax=Chryseobacterium sp. DT-3 TaxID=3396164 RepID=UPI003F1CFE66